MPPMRLNVQQLSFGIRHEEFSVGPKVWLGIDAEAATARFAKRDSM
jgi:hypothetical protein